MNSAFHERFELLLVRGNELFKPVSIVLFFLDPLVHGLDGLVHDEGDFWGQEGEAKIPEWMDAQLVEPEDTVKCLRDEIVCSLKDTVLNLFLQELVVAKAVKELVHWLDLAVLLYFVGCFIIVSFYIALFIWFIKINRVIWKFRIIVYFFAFRVLSLNIELSSVLSSLF